MRGAVLALCLAMTACKPFETLLKHLGFTQLAPPSQLMAPGTMVWVEKTHPFKAGIICTQATSLGAQFRPINSPTSTHSLQKADGVKVEMGADILEMLAAKADVHALRKISVELHNPVVYTLSDMDVLTALPKRDPICAMAVSQRLQAGFPVTMISQALMADVSYSVSWDSGVQLDARAKAEILSHIAPHLGVTQGDVSESTISGKSLFWGIQDDVYLSKLALGANWGKSAANPQGVPPARDGDEPERIIDIQDRISLAPGLDTDHFEDDSDLD